jgi:hypothetical protein
MRRLLVVLLLAGCAFAQDPSGGAAAACGPKATRFDVKRDDSQHALKELVEVAD